MIAALFVQRGGVYWDLPGVDPWDEARDARKYAGPWPVVAHPPCTTWGVFARQGKTNRSLGDDDGCFASALDSVRRWGGVLEHPALSSAWDAYELVKPVRGAGWQRALMGDLWVCEVEQGHYGHPCRKATWLLAGGVELPSLRWGPSSKPLDAFDSLTRTARSRTPIPFRDLLLSIARTAGPPTYTHPSTVDDVRRGSGLAPSDKHTPSPDGTHRGQSGSSTHPGPAASGNGAGSPTGGT